MLRLLHSWSVRVGLTVLSGAILAIPAFRSGWFTPVDLKAYDLGLYVRPPAQSQGDVVLVAIDRYSTEVCFPPPAFPISSHIAQHALAVSHLKEAGARVIAFDLLFDHLDPKLDFEPLLSALGEAGNVVLASVIEKQTLLVGGTRTGVREERLVLPSDRISPSLYRVGLVNVPLDADQVARRSYFGRELQGAWYPSLAAAAVSAFSPQRSRNLKKSESFYTDFSPPKDGLPRVTYADVLNGEGWQKAVEGRIALVGVVESGLTDVHKSPVSDLPGGVGGYQLPGVLFHAYAIQTLLRNDMITPTPVLLSFLLCSLLIVGISFVVSGRRLWLSLTILVLLAMVILVAGICLVALRITILPTGKLAAVALLTGVAGILINFSHTKAKSSQQEDQLEEISSDMKTAQQIQRRLQPESIPVMKEVEISGLQIPCKEIGGDYYDVIEVGNNQVAVMVADVSGKGISGALVMSNFQSLVHSLAPKLASPSQLFAELNQAVAKIVTMGRFVTFFYGILNRQTKEFTYCNAGHTYPIWRKAGGRVTELSEGGLFLGPFPEARWEDKQIRLDAGDLILVYTDGVTEAAIAGTEQQFGEERLKTYLEKTLPSSPKDVPGQLLRELQRFTRRETFEDDVTMLCLRVL